MDSLLFEVSALLQKGDKIYRYEGYIALDGEESGYLDEGESVDAVRYHDQAVREYYYTLRAAAEYDNGIRSIEGIHVDGTLTDLGVVAQDYAKVVAAKKSQS
jgi:hypothetical protein